MFTHYTSGQVIIGLRSLHPLKRAIKEKHFKKVLVVFSKDREALYYVGYIRRFLKHLHLPHEMLAADLRRDTIVINPEVDLIISIGIRHVHDIAKISNTNHAALYCIESVPGHLSSYGIGAVWIKKNVERSMVMPDLIFNSCHHAVPWGIRDITYFLLDISMSLQACLSKWANDLVIASGIGGIVEFFRIYDLITKTKKPRKLRKLFSQLCYADLLMKNADNNLPLPLEAMKIARATEHYRQFEVAIASESFDVIDNHLKKNGKKLDQMLIQAGSNITLFQKQFTKLFNEYTNHPEQWNFAGDILGKKIKIILGENTKTRRVN